MENYVPFPQYKGCEMGKEVPSDHVYYQFLLMKALL